MPPAPWAFSCTERRMIEGEYLEWLEPLWQENWSAGLEGKRGTL